MAFHIFNTELAHAANDLDISQGTSSNAFVTPRGLSNKGLILKTSGEIDIGQDSVSLRNSSDNVLSFLTSGTERVRVEADGNVLFLDAVTETSINAFNTTIPGGNLIFNVQNGTVVLGSASSSITGYNFNSVPTGGNRSITVTAMILNTGSYTYGDLCAVNGSGIPGGVRWAYGVAPVATTGTDVLTFSVVRDSTGATRVFGFTTSNMI
jgi:hypothetical protein